MPEWERVKLGEIVQEISRPERVQADKRYRLLGTRWYAGGLFIKDEKLGSAIQANSLYRIEEGDFVYNRLFAWKGSFAIATTEQHGCYASNEFPCFAVNSSRLDPEFLRYYFMRPASWTEALGLSSGSTPTSRNRLKQEKLLNILVPLPPLPEQRRIVARVKGLLERVEEARRLRAEVVAQLDAYSRSVQAASSTRSTPVSELVRLKSPDVTVAPNETYHFAGVYSFGRGVFVGQKKQGQDFAYPRLTRLQAGNFTYPKLMAWEGAFGLVPAECDGLVVSTEYPVFEIDSQKILPEVLESYFKNPRVWPEIAGESTGTNARRRRLNPADFLGYQFPLPSKADQLRIAHASQATRRVQRQQKQTQIELDALPSAILARAFAGAL